MRELTKNELTAVHGSKKDTWATIFEAVGPYWSMLDKAYIKNKATIATMGKVLGIASLTTLAVTRSLWSTFGYSAFFALLCAGYIGYKEGWFGSEKE